MITQGFFAAFLLIRRRNREFSCRPDYQTLVFLLCEHLELPAVSNSWWLLTLVILDIGVVSKQADLVTSQPPFVAENSSMIKVSICFEIIWRYQASLARHRAFGCHF